MSAFEQHKIEDLASAVTNLIKRCKTMAEVTQKVIMGLAYDIEVNQNTHELNRFMRELSTENSSGKLIPSSIARSVGVYMKNHLPLEWDSSEQVFILMEGEFDYQVAHELMSATRWDKFNKKTSDDEYDADTVLARAISMIKGIVAKHDAGKLQDDDPAYLQARKFSKLIA